MACDAEETPYDDEDGDCDPSTPDFDLDGDGDNAQSARIRAGTDCDDNDPRTNPAAPELCGDGKDNNCDGRIDEPACADRDAPAVRFGGPAAGLAYAGTLEVVVEAQDDTSIAQVRLFGPGGQVLGTSSNVPARFMVDTTRLSDGPVTLEAEAQDVADRKARASLAIVIDNRTPPEMTILSPLEGESYVGVMQLEAQAIDASQVRDVSISVDGAPPVVLSVPPYVRLVDTATLSEGPHRATLVAADLRGNSVSRQVSFFVDRTPPRLAVAMPTDGARVNGTFEVYIEADDPTPGAGLRQLVSTPGALGPRVTSDRRLRYSIDTVALRISNGPFVIRTTAVDWARGPAGAQGNTTTLELSVVIDNTNVTADAGVAFDAGDPPDAGIDAGGMPDAGVPDAGAPSGGSDAGALDAGSRPDSGVRVDAGALDSGAATPFLEQVDISPFGGQGYSDLFISGISADGRSVGFIANGFYARIYSRDLWVRDGQTTETWTPPPYDNATQLAVFSASGRAAAFVSNAPIDLSDMDGQADVYVRTENGTLSIASIANDGTNYTNRPSVDAISADGRFVLFDDSAPLAPDDTNAASDVYLRDTLLGTTERVSLMADGSQVPYAYGFALSDDGRYIVFRALGPKYAREYGFIRDRHTGNTMHLTRLPDLLQGHNSIDSAVISPNGQFVLFMVSSGGYAVALYEYEVGTGLTRELTPPFRILDVENQKYRDNWSEDGRFLTFLSAAPLVPEDDNRTQDVYVWDRQSSRVARASLSPTGTQFRATCSDTQISRDGRHIVFQSAYNPFFPNQQSIGFHIFKAPNPLWTPTADAGFPSGDGGSPADASLDAGVQDAGVPDASSPDGGPADWDTFDPNEVYIWGVDFNGMGGLVHWARPLDVSAAFPSSHSPAFGSFIRNDGKYIFAERPMIGSSRLIREFRCDPTQDCAAFSTQLKLRQFPRYPQDPFANDLLINTSACAGVIDARQIWGTPDGRTVFLCDNDDELYDDTGSRIDIPREIANVLAFGIGDTILGEGILSSDIVLSDPLNGLQELHMGIKPRFARSVPDGFIVVGKSATDQDELWKIDIASGAATHVGTYPPVPSEVSSAHLSSEALDGQGAFFQIMEVTSVRMGGVLVRRTVSGASDIVYRTRDHHVDSSSRSRLVTGR